MKIVIDVNENDFLACKYWLHEGVAQWAEAIIAKGTVLPKGHGDLIDKKVAYRKFYSRCYAKVAEEVFSEVPIVIEADK